MRSNRGQAFLLTNKWCFPKFTWLQDGYNIRMLSEFSGFSLVICRAVVVCISERQFSPPGFRYKQPFPIRARTFKFTVPATDISYISSKENGCRQDATGTNNFITAKITWRYSCENCKIQQWRRCIATEKRWIFPKIVEPR